MIFQKKKMPQEVPTGALIQTWHCATQLKQKPGAYQVAKAMLPTTKK
jgi:hypothetical protein